MLASGAASSAPDIVIPGLVAEALSICAQVERGHGRGTLAARFEQIKSAAATLNPVIITISLSEAAVRQAGALLAELQESERRTQTTTGSMSADALRGGERWTRGGLFSTPISDPAFRSEWLAASVAGCAAVAIVAGTEDDALSAQSREILKDLAGIMPALQPWVVPGAGARKPVRAWWEDAALGRAALRLPPLVPPQSAPTIAAVAALPAARPAMALALARALQSALDSLAGLLAREAARQRALKGREDRAVRAAESRPAASSGDRDASERVRRRLEDAVTHIERQIEEQNRRALLPTSNLNQVIGQMLASLSEQDLEQAEAYNEIKVTIRADFAARLLDSAKREIRNQFKDDVHQIKTGADGCREALAEEIRQVTGSRQTLPGTQVDENAIWLSLREALALQLAFHGTLPRRGFWQRLAEGKQLMFTMLSLVGLGGMVLGFQRQDIGTLIAVGLPVVFFVGVGLTFWNWRQEDAARLGKEIDRIREQVGSEVKRLVSEVQREKMARLKETIEGLRKDLARRVEGALRDHQTSSADHLSRARNEARDRQRALDLRIRELQPLGTQLSRLRQASSDAARAAQEALRALSKPGGVA